MRFLTGEELVEDCGDFRAISKPVIIAIRRFREPHRFIRGLFSHLGFAQCTIRYDRAPRFAGETKYPLRKMVRLAFDAVLSFSASPVRAIVWLSLILWTISLVYLGKAIYEHFVLGVTVQGWTSLVTLLSFYTGLILFCLGVLGQYVSRIFEQNQSRPLYWLSDARNIDLQRATRQPLCPVECQLSWGIVSSQSEHADSHKEPQSLRALPR